MRRMKNRIAIYAPLAVSAFLVGGQALAAENKTTCARGGDARVIEVIAPGQVGQACDVRYTRSGDNVSVPYHANNSDAFCNQKARELTGRLASAGYTCTSAAPSLRAEADTGVEPAAALASAVESATPTQSDYVVEAQRSPSATPPAAGTTAPDAAVAAAQNAEIEKARAQLAATQTPPVEPIAAGAPEQSLDAAPAEPHDAAGGDLEAQMNEILAQPAQVSAQIGTGASARANGAPAQLIAQQATPTSSRPQPSVVGRIVGASPEAQRPVSQSSVTAATPASVVGAASPPNAEPVGAPAVEPTPKPIVPAAPAAAETTAPANTNNTLRTPQEVILATLRAQMAAWNEGDLDAFMETYWKDADLKFVSGTTIKRGWDATMKRYRDSYGGGEGLGQLGVERLDVKMITDDVAILTGRFNHMDKGVTSSGVFSLIWRRDNGAWRIVHDHTSPETAPE